MEILYFKSLDSTQKHLKKLIQLDMIASNCVVVADVQTAGIGSKNNEWSSTEGNLFFSVALMNDTHSSDIPLQSTSVFYGYLIKEIVKKYEKNVWLKWPNDIYNNESKIGGIITQKVKNFLVVGCGLNLRSNNAYMGIDKDIDKKILLNQILKVLESDQKWKEVFSKYRLEFNRSKEFVTTVCNEKVSLKNAKLCDDGSLELEGKRIYSLR